MTLSALGLVGALMLSTLAWIIWSRSRPSASSPSPPPFFSGGYMYRTESPDTIRHIYDPEEEWTKEERSYTVQSILLLLLVSSFVLFLI